MGKEIPGYSADYEIEGENESGRLGWYFGIGDINGDQFDDLLFSSRKYLGELGDTSNLHIFYGSQSPTFVLGQESKKYRSYIRENKKWGEWFNYKFSVDDINDDGFADVVVGRGSLLPKVTNIHYGSASGIDTIPDFILTVYDTVNDVYTGGISQGIGDYNEDGYDDFVTWGGYRTFSLYLGGPWISNQNKIGLLGFLGLMYGSVFPCTAMMISDQDGNGGGDLLLNARSIDSTYYGNAFMVYGNRSVHTDVKEEKGKDEFIFKLENNYPNPFNPETVISYQLPKSGKVKLELFTILGEKITTLIDENKEAGTYDYHLSASKYKLTSGIYIVRMLSDDYSKSIKMNLIK